MKVKLHLSIWRATNGFVLQVDHAPRMIFFTKEEVLQELNHVLDKIESDKIPADMTVAPRSHVYGEEEA